MGTSAPAPAFDLLLAENPRLRVVRFFRFRCEKHGTFRVLGDDHPQLTCPLCGAAAVSSRPLKVKGATARTPLPVLEDWRWRDVTPFTALQKKNLDTLLEEKEAPPDKVDGRRCTGVCCRCTRGDHG